MRSAAADTVSGIIEKWSASFNKLDADARASLYSKHAFFFGSNPSLYRGNEGVVAYFNALPRWKSPTVQFSDVRTAQVSDRIDLHVLPELRSPEKLILLSQRAPRGVNDVAVFHAAHAGDDVLFRNVTDELARKPWKEVNIKPTTHSSGVVRRPLANIGSSLQPVERNSFIGVRRAFAASHRRLLPLG